MLRYDYGKSGKWIDLKLVIDEFSYWRLPNIYLCLLVKNCKNSDLLSTFFLHYSIRIDIYLLLALICPNWILLPRFSRLPSPSDQLQRHDSLCSNKAIIFPISCIIFSAITLLLLWLSFWPESRMALRSTIVRMGSSWIIIKRELFELLCWLWGSVMELSSIFYIVERVYFMIGCDEPDIAVIIIYCKDDL